LKAQLDIPDLPNDGAKSIETIAEATGTRKAALLQAMRALAALGIFAEPRSDHSDIIGRIAANQCAKLVARLCRHGGERHDVAGLGQPPDAHYWYTLGATSV